MIRLISQMLSYHPEHLLNALNEIKQSHGRVKFSSSYSKVPPIKARIERAASMINSITALTLLSQILSTQEVDTIVKHLGKWESLRQSASLIIQQHPRETHVKELWKLWQENPQCKVILGLLREMVQIYGIAYAVNDLYCTYADNWIRSSNPIDSMVSWMKKNKVTPTNLPKIPNSPFLTNSRLIECLNQRVLQVGETEQLLLFSHSDVLKHWQKLSEADRIRACVNFLKHVRHVDWNGRDSLLKFIRKKYGLPDTKSKNSKFWGLLPDSICRDFQTYFGKKKEHPLTTVKKCEKTSISSDWWLKPKVKIRDPHLRGVYCLGYRIGKSENDQWTVRINRFKKGEEHNVRKALKALRYAAPSLFRCIGISPETTVVIPVLGSQETRASSKSKVSRLSKSIADGVNAKFELSCLSKNQHESLHKQTDQYARDRALAKADYKASKLDKRFHNVLIIDDIVTRGATMSAVAKAIKDANPSVKIYGFVLGRHQRKEWLSVPFEKANAGIPSKLARVWDQD